MADYFKSLQTLAEAYSVAPWRGLKDVLAEIADEDNQ